MELYKLDVCGKDSFFKAHKDTPRHETMFESLVAIFPTQHEGGEFVLREGDREWSLDSAKMLSECPHQPYVGYVSFFSDVEHGVREVTSGYRFTLTYNLYFIPENQAPIGTASAPAPYEESPAAPLYTLLTDPTVLPKGGYLAFGLRSYHLNEIPLPQLANRRLTLPCFSHRVTVVRRKSADPPLSSYTYET